MESVAVIRIKDCVLTCPQFVGNLVNVFLQDVLFLVGLIPEPFHVLKDRMVGDRGGLKKVLAVVPQLDELNGAIFSLFETLALSDGSSISCVEVLLGATTTSPKYTFVLQFPDVSLRCNKVDCTTAECYTIASKHLKRGLVQLDCPDLTSKTPINFNISLTINTPADSSDTVLSNLGEGAAELTAVFRYEPDHKPATKKRCRCFCLNIESGTTNSTDNGSHDTKHISFSNIANLFLRDHEINTASTQLLTKRAIRFL
jgi:hypothetical protein